MTIIKYESEDQKNGTHTQGIWEIMERRHDDLVIVGDTESENGPWYIADIVSNCGGGQSNEGITKEAEANGEHICRCVNSHDELVEACEFARECSKGPIDGLTLDEAANKVRRMLNAALNKAEA